MKYNENAKVFPEIEAKARQDIESMNKYLDGLKGTLICVENTYYSKQPYRDTDAGYLISLYHPNQGTTNGVGIRVISEAQAKEIARIVCGPFEDKEKAGPFGTYLESITPEQDPVGVQPWKDRMMVDGVVRSAAWRLRIITPSTE